jgi:hypothetical protein
MSLAGLVVFLATAGPAHAAGQPKRIVGGNIVTSPEEAPWSVLVTGRGSDGTGICTGSLISPTRVLTAGHCVVDEQGNRLAPGAFLLMTGIVDAHLGADWTRMQTRSVGSVSVHPYFSYADLLYDVAVLDVAQPFDVSGAAVRPIGLAAAAATGTARLYGFGRYNVAQNVDGKLRALDQGILRASYCGPGDPARSCGYTTGGAACFGDSGGGLLSGAGLAGVSSYLHADGDDEADCDLGEVTGYTDLTAPAIAQWLAGNGAPPRAPRSTGRVTLTAGDPLTCQSPAWSDSPQVSYDFVASATGAVLQSGPATYHPTGAALGHPVFCVAVARNAGGSSEVPSAPVTMYDPGLGIHVAANGAVAVSRASETAPISRVVIFNGAGAEVGSFAFDPANPMSVPKLPAGRYSVCVQSGATPTFVASSACQSWIVAGKAADLLAPGSIRRWHGRWRVTLRVSPGLVGKRVTLRWKLGKARHATVRRKLTATTRVNTPRVARSVAVRLTAIAPATTADGVPYAAGQKVFRIRR